MTGSTVMKLSIAAATTTLIALGTAGSATAASLYSITDLGTPTGDLLSFSAYATDINDLGQVVGYFGRGAIFDRAFLWDSGNITVLPALSSLPNVTTIPTAINNNGQIVGYVRPGRPSAVLWENNTAGQYTAIPLVPPSPTGSFISAAYDINNLGQAVGVSNSLGLGIFRPVLWENGTTTALENIGAGGNFLTTASINDNGQVVGPGFLWESGTVTALPGTANAINNLGQIVGSRGGNAFLWSNGVTTDLATLDSSSIANDINELGQIVGSSFADGNQSRRAVLWENTSINDLNSLLVNNPGWSLSSASAINSKGQIVGYGSFNGQTRAFLLNPVSESAPVPEPASVLGLLAFSTFGVGAIAKRGQEKSKVKC